MTWHVGKLIREAYVTGVPGETFTRDTSRIDGSTSLFAPTFTEIGNRGSYEISYSPAVPGVHTWYGSGSSSGPVALTWDVLTLAQADPAAALASTVSAVTTLTERLTSARAAKLDRIGSDAQIVEAGILADGDRLDIRRGNAYLTANGNAKQWTYDGPAFASATLTLRTYAGTQALQAAVTRSGDTLSADLTGAQTAALALGTPIYRYEIEATYASGDAETLVSGVVWVAD